MRWSRGFGPDGVCDERLGDWVAGSSKSEGNRRRISWDLSSPQVLGRSFRVAPIFSTDATHDSSSSSMAPMTVLMLASCATMLLLISSSKWAALLRRR